MPPLLTALAGSLQQRLGQAAIWSEDHAERCCMAFPSPTAGDTRDVMAHYNVPHTCSPNLPSPAFDVTAANPKITTTLAASVTNNAHSVILCVSAATHAACAEETSFHLTPAGADSNNST